jgi:gliding motility-associated-like protein
MFNTGDQVYAKVSSSLGCATGSPATSNPITIIKPSLLQIVKVDTVNESCSLDNGSITITASGGTANYKYSITSPPSWKNDPVFDSLSSSIPYNIQVQDYNGCLAYKGTYVLSDKQGIALSTTGAGKYCEGDTIVLKASAFPIPNYTWLLPSGKTDNSDQITLLSVTKADTGTYRVIAIDPATTCSDTTWMRVEINLMPEVSLGQPSMLCSGTEYVLTPGPDYKTYQWQDGSSFTSFLAINQGIYSVEVSDNNGCYGSDTVELVPCSQVFLPNAFSPDGNNKVFRPVTGGLVLLDFNMVIYNRWGQMIFETKDYHTGWDGKYNETIVPSGIYSYFITYNTADPANSGATKSTQVRGTVMVVR